MYTTCVAMKKVVDLIKANDVEGFDEIIPDRALDAVRVGGDEDFLTVLGFVTENTDKRIVRKLLYAAGQFVDIFEFLFQMSEYLSNKGKTLDGVEEFIQDDINKEKITTLKELSDEDFLATCRVILKMDSVNGRFSRHIVDRLFQMELLPQMEFIVKFLTSVNHRKLAAKEMSQEFICQVLGL